MIKLATVFSGIGAIEHALDRMDIEHKIVFACDNGDIDVLSKKIELNMDHLKKELSSLKSLIKNMEFSEDDDYEKQLREMLDHAEIEFNNVKNTIDSTNIDNYEKTAKDILNSILTNSNLNKNRVKVYNEFKNLLNSDISLTEEKLLLYQIILKISNDFKNDNSLDDLGKENVEFTSAYNINWNELNIHLKSLFDQMEEDNGKRIINSVRNLSQRVGQLYGKINSLYHLNELKKIDSYSEKKKYVDNLYMG